LNKTEYHREVDACIRRIDLIIEVLEKYGSRLTLGAWENLRTHADKIKTLLKKLEGGAL
jgi:hypothetical protein